MYFLRSLRRAGVLVLASTAFVISSPAQDSNRLEEQQALANSIHELQEQIADLRSAVAELRSEAAQYHAENAALQERVRALQQKVSTPGQAQTTLTAEGESPVGQSLEQNSFVSGSAPQQNKTSSIQEQIDLLSGKISEQYQTKIESGSKYRVRLSGIALFNAFANRGSVDNIDFAHVVTPGVPGLSQKSVGGSLRQSLFGLEAFGPDVAGARSSAEVQFDFAGGFANVPNGVNLGIVRLRTATLHLDWHNTSLVAGQDNLFFAPLSPTSLASLAVPALSYAGNLWNWTPQLRIEHRIQLSTDSAINLQAGVLDPVTGEFPYVNYYRAPSAGERSGVPGLASRIAYSTKSSGEPLTVGVGGYYSREDWGFGRTVDGWAGMTDISVPLGHLFNISGAFYRGRGIGGLGGAQNRSIVWSGDLSSPATIVRGLDDLGGWAQLKFKPMTRLEFNFAAGQDSAFRNDVAAFPTQNYYGRINANRNALANFIYHPRSDLVFSAEYDRLRTTSIYDYSSANHVSLSMGILF